MQAGQVLARLSPTIPVADLGTMQQLRAEVAGKLKVAEQKGNGLAVLKEGANIGDVVRALNAIGVTPRDLIGIR